MGSFEDFYEHAEPRLRRALVAALGPVRGRDAAAEALAYAWEEWEKVGAMDAPLGYLFRVGQSKTRGRRAPVVFPPAAERTEPWVEPGLPAALEALAEQQRVCVVLAHGYGWTHREIAEVLGVARTTVQNHVERGLARLRSAMEVTADD